MLIADELYDGESQTCTLDVYAGVMSSVETVKDPREVLLGNTDTVIFDCYVDLLCCNMGYVTGTPSAYFDLCLRIGVVDCVGDEIFEDT